jgi:hypothetical protein
MQDIADKRENSDFGLEVKRGGTQFQRTVTPSQKRSSMLREPMQSAIQAVNDKNIH